MPPRKNAEANSAAARNAHEPNQAQAQALKEQAGRLARLEKEAQTLRRTNYWIVAVMIVAYAACMHRVGAGLSAVHQQQHQMMMMMAANNQQTITTTVEVLPNTAQDASTPSSPETAPTLLPRPPPPRKQETSILQLCHTQYDISSTPDFVPTFYEYLGIDISEEPFGSWILSTANLSDTTLSLIYDKRHHGGCGMSSSSYSTASGAQAPPRCCPSLLGLHALENHEDDVSDALMKAVTSRGPVVKIYNQLRGSCDLFSCGGEGWPDGDGDGDGGEAGGQGGGHDSDVIKTPNDLLLNFITTTQQQGQEKGQYSLLDEDQHKSMALISKVYGNLADRALARAYNRAFMSPLITAAAAAAAGQAAGEDGGGGGSMGGDHGRDDDGGGNACLALRLPQSHDAREAWLDRVCGSDE